MTNTYSRTTEFIIYFWWIELDSWVHFSTGNNVTVLFNVCFFLSLLKSIFFITEHLEKNGNDLRLALIRKKKKKRKMMMTRWQQGEDKGGSWWGRGRLRRGRKKRDLRLPSALKNKNYDVGKYSFFYSERFLREEPHKLLPWLTMAQF